MKRAPHRLRRLTLGGLAAVSVALCLVIGALSALGRGDRVGAPQPGATVPAAGLLVPVEPASPRPTSVASATPPVATIPSLSPAAPTTQPAGYPPLPAGLSQAHVVRVIDGDTVDVELDGRRERLRLIGIDTPETVHPSMPVMCYGQEASARATELLQGQTVLLEEDQTQDSRDHYGRLLRYVWLPDGRLFNLEMIAEGYAVEYTYRVPYIYAEQFRAAQAEARDYGRGLWASTTCAGQAIPADATPAATQATAAPAATATAPAPAGSAAAPLLPSFDGCRADPNAPRAPHRPLRIVDVDKDAETVTLQNVGAAAIDLGGWTMCSVRGTQRHPLSGSIQAGATRSFPNDGRPIWNNGEPDPGLLYNPEGILISAWSEGP